MKIVCGSCGAKYSIADEKVQGKVFKIRCKKCSDVIVVKGTADGADSEEAESDFGAAYGGSEGASEWYVVIDGEQVGPITPEEVEAYFTVGQLSAESYVWREGLENWAMISALSEFAHLTHETAGPDEHTMIAPQHQELPPPEDATAVIQAGQYAQQYESNAQPAYDDPTLGFNETYPATSEPAGGYGAEQPSAGYGGYESDYAQEGGGGYDAGYGAEQPSAGYGGYDAPSSNGQQGYGSNQVSVAPGYGGASGSPDDSYDSDGGGGMFAAFDSASAEESDYGGGFGGGFGGGSSDAGYDSGGDDSLSANDMVGARNENSVLFSLSSLDQVQAVSKTSGGGGGGSSSPGPGAPNDKSGLIDIQALASAHSSMKGMGKKNEFDATPDSFGPSTMSMPALMPMPMGSHRSNKGLMIAVVVGVAFVLIAVVVGVVVVLKMEPKTQTIIESTVAEAAPVVAVEVDPKAAAEAAEAAKAALAVADGVAPVEEKEDPREDSKTVAAADRKTAAATKTTTTTTRSDSAPTKTEPKTTTKTAKGGGGIDDIIGQIDKKGSTSEPTAKTAAAPAADLPPRLSRPMVQSTVRQYNAQIMRCHQTANSGNLSGTVNVRFTVEPNGSVSAADVLAGEFRGTDVGGCIEGAVKNMKFPATQSDLTINYPFIVR
ncbi:MAG: zinc-ribbon domain-containing protein [Bradymonadaceae bacterium]|nr:zinc-ribbon domain-containing protein [Lujinxingiaceae bacterium]